MRYRPAIRERAGEVFGRRWPAPHPGPVRASPELRTGRRVRPPNRTAVPHRPEPRRRDSAPPGRLLQNDRLTCRYAPPKHSRSRATVGDPVASRVASSVILLEAKTQRTMGSKNSSGLPGYSGSKEFCRSWRGNRHRPGTRGDRSNHHERAGLRLRGGTSRFSGKRRGVRGLSSCVRTRRGGRWRPRPRHDWPGRACRRCREQRRTRRSPRPRRVVGAGGGLQIVFEVGDLVAGVVVQTPEPADDPAGEPGEFGGLIPGRELVDLRRLLGHRGERGGRLFSGIAGGHTFSLFSLLSSGVWAARGRCTPRSTRRRARKSSKSM